MLSFIEKYNHLNTHKYDKAGFGLLLNIKRSPKVRIALRQMTAHENIN